MRRRRGGSSATAGADRPGERTTAGAVRSECGFGAGHCGISAIAIAALDGRERPGIHRLVLPVQGKGRFASPPVRYVLQMYGIPARWRGRRMATELGRASCRERVRQSVEISVVAGSLKK